MFSVPKGLMTLSKEHRTPKVSEHYLSDTGTQNIFKESKVQKIELEKVIKHILLNLINATNKFKV